MKIFGSKKKVIFKFLFSGIIIVFYLFFLEGGGFVFASTPAETSVTISDEVSPIISSIQISTITDTSAIVNWVTHELSTSFVDYGISQSLGQTSGDSSMVTSHSVLLSNLTSNTLYYFQVRSVDYSDNSATDNNGGSYYSFTTIVTASPGGGAALPSESISTVLDIEELEIFLENSAPFTRQQNIEVGFKNFENIAWVKFAESPDLNQTPWQKITKEIFWKLSKEEGKKILYFQFKDEEGRVSEPVEENIILDITAPSAPVNFEGELIDDHIEIKWQLPKDGDAVGVRVFKSKKNFILNAFSQEEIIFEGGTEKIFDFEITEKETYYYSAFCYDHARNYSSSALLKIQVPSASLIPLVPPFPSVEEKEILFKREPKLFFLDLSTNTFYVGLDKKEKGLPMSLRRFHYLEETPLTIKIHQNQFLKKPKSIVLNIEDIFYYGFQQEGDSWKVKFETPRIRENLLLTMEIFYIDGVKEKIELGQILIDPYGYVYQRIYEPHLKLFKNGLWSWEVTERENRLEKVKVFLYQLNENKKEWHLFEAHQYNQKNPQLTNQEGGFGFMVPEGVYYLEAIKIGFGEKKSEIFRVTDSIVNKNIALSSIIIPWRKVEANRNLLTVLLIVLTILCVIIVIRVTKIIRKLKEIKKRKLDEIRKTDEQFYL